MLDAGNSLSGDKDPAKKTKGASSVEAMNLLGYDAVALSSADLALGVRTLREHQSKAKFKFLSANVRMRDPGRLFTTPFITREVDGFRVAVVGLTDEGGKRVPPSMAVSDPMVELQALMPELQREADVIVVLSHAGRKVDERIAAEVPGVDWIISGGDADATKRPIINPKTGVGIVQADHGSEGHAGRYVGIADLRWNADGSTSHDWRLVTLDSKVKSDSGLNEWVQKWKK